ncbi:5'-nucleotidase [Luteimicrobium album]|uniref:5'-nucleotidase n=1 Tax=Luteimicrobium album TaxID=1054550 RepID=A0ABQ6I0P8_9MICO|nr:HAD hydrolase-like protein [Luteimicrobium album]GMA24261.1 5'-nucleotidase [Luteimicrobium album]
MTVPAPASSLDLPALPPGVVLLDLDGTLTDSAPGIVGSLRAALTEAGLPVPDDAALRRFVGPPLPGMLRASGAPADRVDELVTTYRRHFTAGGMFDNAVFPGIEEAMDALRDAGAVLAVATSKPEVYARQIAEHFGLDAHLTHGLDGVFGADTDLGTRAGKAEVVAHALASLAERGVVARPATTVMVGDREHDVLGAGRHGIATVGVAWGYAEPGELEAAGAVAVVHTPRELTDLLLGAP